MKIMKHISVLLVFALLISVIVPISASAATFSEQTAFEFALSHAADANAPGDILGEVYVETDPTKLITTFGATLVVDTEYIDLVDVDGNVVTDRYKKDSKVLGGEFPVYEAKIKSGKKTKSFSSMQGLSIASYNPNSKLMYVFICGLNIGGVKIEEKSKVAGFYMKSKTGGKIPASAVRTMRVEELGTSCRSKAVFVAEISSTTEVGDTACKISLSADDALVDKTVKPETTTEAPTTEAPTSEVATTEAPTSQEAATEPSAQGGDEDMTEAETTTLPVEEMSEPALEQEIKDKIEIAESIVVPEAKQQTPTYKAYQKAVEKAKEVLEDEDATKEEKQEALQELREAQEQLKEEVPEVAPQIKEIEKQQQASAAKKPWVFIGIGGAVAVIAAAIIIGLIFKKKKKV